MNQKAPTYLHTYQLYRIDLEIRWHKANKKGLGEVRGGFGLNANQTGWRPDSRPQSTRGCLLSAKSS